MEEAELESDNETSDEFVRQNLLAELANEFRNAIGFCFKLWCLYCGLAAAVLITMNWIVDYSVIRPFHVTAKAERILDRRDETYNDHPVVVRTREMQAEYEFMQQKLETVRRVTDRLERHMIAQSKFLCAHLSKEVADSGRWSSPCIVPEPVEVYCDEHGRCEE